MIRRLTLATALLILCLSSAPRPVVAFDFFQGADCGNHKNASSVACSSQSQESAKGNPNPLTGPDGLLARITNIVAYAAGAAAVIVIIISALRFITSGSNVSTGSRTDTDVEEARRSLAGAVIGLIVIVLAHTIIIYIVKRL
jgi:hypothetical protein